MAAICITISHKLACLAFNTQYTDSLSAEKTSLLYTRHSHVCRRAVPFFSKALSAHSLTEKRIPEELQKRDMTPFGSVEMKRKCARGRCTDNCVGGGGSSAAS